MAEPHPISRGFTMELAYDRPALAAIGLALDDASRILMRRGWWRRRRTPLWFVGHQLMRLGSDYLRRGGQRVIIDGQLLTPAQVARFDHGLPWMDPVQREPRWRRLWRCLTESA